MGKKVLYLVFILIFFISNFSHSESFCLNGECGILIEANSGRVLYEHNAHKKQPMASTTKIMTALVALENGNLDEIVTIDKDSVGIEGSSIYLYEGEKITLEDLLYGLMLKSGNDASIAIANHIGGDVNKFVNLMNKNAKQIGANNTSFVNPHGLDDEAHYSTAYDLAIITKEAFKIEMFKKIVNTQKWVANRSNNNYFYNKNKTLWQYDGGNGVKTGYTKRSGRCLVASANKNDVQLIAVVLNDGDWFNDCYKLFDLGFNNFFQKTIFKQGQFIDKVKVIGGNKEEITAVTKNKFVFPLKKNEEDKIKVFYNLPPKLNAPINKGDKIGEISVYLDGKLICSEKLISKENVNKLNIMQKMIRSLKN